MPQLENITFARREWRYLAFLCLAFIGIYFFNYIAMQVDTVKEEWRSMILMPTYGPPVGVDFNFLYETSKRFMIEGVNPYNSFCWYPPFSVWFFIPFTFFSYYNAYLLQMVVTTLMLLAAVAILLRLAVRHLAIEHGIQSPLLKMLAIYIGTMVCMQMLSGYPYAYAMERGNNDAYPIFFLAIALWLMIERPKTIWWQVLCITAATHIKVYPAVFFLAIFWRHGWRSMLPIVVLNVGALFSLGIDNALFWMRAVSIYNNATINFLPPNHAMPSFVMSVLWPLINPEQSCPAWLVKGSVLLPLALWGGSAFILLRRGISALSLSLFLAISIPLMNLLPATSNDYKIILVYPLLAFFLFLLTVDYLFLKKPLAMLLTVMVLLISSLLTFNGLFSRTTYLETGYINPFTASKTPALLLLQIVLLVWIAGRKPNSLKSEQM